MPQYEPSAIKEIYFVWFAKKQKSVDSMHRDTLSYKEMPFCISAEEIRWENMRTYLQMAHLESVLREAEGVHFVTM